MRDTVDAIKKRRDSRRTGGSSADNVTVGGGVNGGDGSLIKRDRSRERERDDHRDGGR